MATEFGTGKSIFILAIVAGCFAILWPNIFYPMIVGNTATKGQQSSNGNEHLRQERPPHLHPEFLHPALREKGRAIPQSHVVPKIKQQEGRPGPLPGIRPPMGGAGHVVPPPKGSGTMGIVMPMYTIGIVVFFLYTMMKILFKKSDSTSGYEGFSPDPDFPRVVFGERVVHKGFANGKESEDTTKLGDLELDLLKKRLQETEKAMERIVAKMMSLPHNNHSEKEKELEKEIEHLVEDEVKSLDKEEFEEEVLEEEEAEDTGKGVVKVLGMEMTESCEKGAKWSRPPTPLSRPTTPQNIYISGAVPSQSQLLVSDSHTETIPAEDHAVVLTGKVTLSLIGLENEEGSAYKVSSSDQLSENKKDKTECECGLNSYGCPDSFGSEDLSKLSEIENKKTNISADEHEEIKETKDLSATNTDEFDVEDDLEEEYEEEDEEEEDFESNEGNRKDMET